MTGHTKGKQATKGAKQIVEENASTLTFYRNMAMIANAVSIILLFLFNLPIQITSFVISSGVYTGAYQFMAYMSKPKYTDSGQLLDSGVDLNMEGGIAEHVKDVIILTAICQVAASAISTYFWLLWLAAPLRAFWMLWKNFLSPYFFQPGVEPEVDEKKQRKLERKMRKQHR